MKRLAFDQQELLRSPVDGVSAAPLDENMLEWHCNFEFDSVIYHVILFFPENYPYKSPSAEFVPAGFQFVGGATKQGKKGTQVGTEGGTGGGRGGGHDFSSGYKNILFLNT